MLKRRSKIGFLFTEIACVQISWTNAAQNFQPQTTHRVATQLGLESMSLQESQSTESARNMTMTQRHANREVTIELLTFAFQEKHSKKLHYIEGILNSTTLYTFSILHAIFMLSASIRRHRLRWSHHFIHLLNIRSNPKLAQKESMIIMKVSSFNLVRIQNEFRTCSN